MHIAHLLFQYLKVTKGFMLHFDADVMTNLLHNKA